MASTARPIAGKPMNCSYSRSNAFFGPRLLRRAAKKQIDGRLDLSVVVPRSVRRKERARDDVAEVEGDDSARDRFARQIGAKLLATLEAIDRLEGVLPEVLAPDGNHLVAKLAVGEQRRQHQAELR